MGRKLNEAYHSRLVSLMNAANVFVGDANVFAKDPKVSSNYNTINCLN